MEELLRILQNKFPNHFFKPGELFSLEYKNSIWSSGEDSEQLYYGSPLFNYYSEDYKRFDMGVNVKFLEFLEKHNAYVEWHDPGTPFIFLM